MPNKCRTHKSTVKWTKCTNKDLATSNHMAFHSQYILTYLCIPLYTQNFTFLNTVFLYDMVQKYTVHMKTKLHVSYLSTWQCMCKVTFAHTVKWNSHATHVNLLYYTCMSRMYCIWMSNVNPVAGVSRTYVWWWRHQMETLSAWLALCAEISMVTSVFHHKVQWRGDLCFLLSAPE